MNGLLETNAFGWRRLVFGSDPRRTLVRVCAWALTVNFVFQVLLLPITVTGSSMQPTYESGNRTIVNRVAYLRKQPQRGDIVVVDTGQREGMIIKRIIALPGETVAIVDGQIQVNGLPLDDQYANCHIPWRTRPVHLKGGEYFVIGDNRPESIFALISRNEIVGRVVF